VALDEGVPITELNAELAAELSRQLLPAVLDGTEVAAPSSGTPPASVFAPLLDRAEARHDLVLLTAGSLLAPDAWTEFCLQQADRILAVTRGGPAPPGLTERHELRGCDLVLYDTTPESGAAETITGLLDPIESHVLRRAQLGTDLARTARRLSGRSVGIVLSGGGARAFSHIGVIEELEAAGVAIDRVAGVSMGAFIGALLAMEIGADEIDAVCFEEWIGRRPLNDYTIPRHALIRGERFRAMLHRTFGSLRIEELPRAFTCSCTELRSGRLVTSRHGPLWEAVGFSMCLPIVAPPQVRGREIFADGSLVDNLPVQEMALLGEGPIIAVDVKPSAERLPDGGAPRHETRPERTPSLGDTVTRVLLLGSANTSEAARRHADLVIKPRVEGIGLLEFHQIDAAREAGRAAARAALEQSAGVLFP
jgi:predicted acylesterase/phospholipase RssA